jgi:hypothetical protein
MRGIVSALAVVVLTVACFASNGGAAAQTYSLTATKNCLRASGAELGQVRRTDRRRIAISDLAQRTSFESRRRGASVIFAFTKGPSEASFLREMLFVPGNPYVLQVQGNVVVMYRPSARNAAAAAIRCLRPQ